MRLPSLATRGNAVAKDGLGVVTISMSLILVVSPSNLLFSYLGFLPAYRQIEESHKAIEHAAAIAIQVRIGGARRWAQTITRTEQPSTMNERYSADLNVVFVWFTPEVSIDSYSCRVW